MEKRLFVFVEGDDDMEFFEKVVRPLVSGRYYLEFIKYRTRPAERVDGFLKSIQSMRERDPIGIDYLLVCDLNNAPCVTARKDEVRQIYKSLENNRIVVVIRQIEGWYLAGIDKSRCKTLGIRHLENTSSVTKEQFNHLIPKRIRARAVFLQQLLEVFSVDLAKQKNESFRYLCRLLGV